MLEGKPTVKDRVEELEVRHAYTDRTVQSLDEVVREFTERVEQLEREIIELRSLLAIATAGQRLE